MNTKDISDKLRNNQNSKMNSINSHNVRKMNNDIIRIKSPKYTDRLDNEK